MSTETITILIGFASLLLALASGFGWMVHRMDGIAKDANGRMDRMGAELNGRMDRMGGELVEIKVAIARVEGPPRQLFMGR